MDTLKIYSAINDANDVRVLHELKCQDILYGILSNIRFTPKPEQLTIITELRCDYAFGDGYIIIHDGDNYSVQNIMSKLEAQGYLTFEDIIDNTSKL